METHTPTHGRALPCALPRGLRISKGTGLGTVRKTRTAGSAVLVLGYARMRGVRDPAGGEKLSQSEHAEQARMLTYIDVLGTAAASGRNSYQLDSAEVHRLDRMVETHYDRPSNWASNLLCAVYGKCRAPYTGEAREPQARRVRIGSEAPPVASSYGVMPNPARGWAVFNYDRKEVAPGDGTITVREVTGKVLATLPMHGPIGQQVWDIGQVAPGTYLVEFRSGAELLHAEKLIVQQ